MNLLLSFQIGFVTGIPLSILVYGKHYSILFLNPSNFEGFKKEAGLNAFTLSPQKWITSTGAIGIVTRPNYHIHTSAISRNLIPTKLSTEQINYIYASEADVLNMALFGMTAKEWRESNPEEKGNIRDHATITELICLSNLENINAVLIADGMPQSERLAKLNQTAIHQMQVLESSHMTRLADKH